MDGREKADDQSVEDLELQAADAEQVKGGAKGNEVAMEELTLANEGTTRRVGPGGILENHNETIVRI